MSLEKDEIIIVEDVEQTKRLDRGNLERKKALEEGFSYLSFSKHFPFSFWTHSDLFMLKNCALKR